MTVETPQERERRLNPPPPQVYIWECDVCHATAENTSRYEQPEGWAVQKDYEKYREYNYDRCSKCVEEKRFVKTW